VRLTLVYFGLFLVSGAALLALTIVLFRGSSGSATIREPAAADSTAAFPTHPGSSTSSTQPGSGVDQLIVVSGIALAVMTIPAVALGWVVAGRVVRPLRTITATAQDISASNLHERLDLAGPADELKELGDTFDALLARLERSFQSERQFVANAAHELRTPLATMRASLDVAMAKPGPHPTGTISLAERLRNELDHMDRLLDSLLALAHTQQSPPEERSTVTLSALVIDALDRHQEAIQRTALHLERADDPDTWVEGNDTLLTRMIDNVIDNAIKHNEPGGWIRIETEVDGAKVSLIVENGGPVVAQADVDELARPFRRLGARRTGSDHGNGLGLSIVESIVAAHHGTLDLHARPDGGLRVAITLPLATAAGSPQ
jgi:signal transduction histidine kinase